MMADHWIDVLRLLSIIGLSYGVWRGWRNRPPGVLYEGRKYHRLPDGRFCTRWGLIVTDPAKLAALATAAGNRAISDNPALEETRPGDS